MMPSQEPEEGAEGEQRGDGQVGAGFGFLLRRYRRDAGLTQEELAARSGLSVRAIRDLERGRAQTPQRESVKALIGALGLGGPGAAALAGAARAARAARTSRIDQAHAGQAELCELPSGLADFTGRSEELNRLRALAELSSPADGRPEASTVVISAILGQAGIGKTALALRMGHELEARFPDARLYVDLRGTDDRPADPAEVLQRFLSALGLPQQLIPAGLEERAARFRALLFKRQALVVLDNAVDEAQVRPLLPASPRSLVLVTSRNVLAGLETPHRLLLDVLAPRDATTMLAEIVGKRAEVEPEAIAEVAELCGFLPLALRIAGNRLASRPAWTVAFLAERLRNEQARLQLLQAGDLQVRAAFAMSYGQASPAARRQFRRLSLVPGPDFGSGLAAVLGETDGATADVLLEELADASLILPADRSGRYRFHDLMRLFAGEMLTAEDDDGTRLAAKERMIEWLLQTAAGAGVSFFLPGQAGAAGFETLTGTRKTAAAWLESERANWMGAIQWAAANQRPGRPWYLADVGWSVIWYHSLRGRWDDWREVCESVVASLRGTGRPAETVFLECLVDALVHLGRGEEALRYADEALEAARKLGRPRHLAWALEVTARAHRLLGRPEYALKLELQALPLFQAEEHRLEEAIVLDGLALTSGRCGRFEEAVSYHRQALDVAKGVLDRTYMAIALVSFGETLMGAGRFAEAAESLRQAAADLASGGDQWREGVAQQDLGRALGALGRFDEAAQALDRAAALFAETGDRYDRAGVLDALGTTLQELGERERAAECWRESLEIYEQLALPEAGKVRRQLYGRD
jgi:tetratricopeptide (TPR) repeat protein